MKLDISGFEWIRGVQFFWLLIEEELLCEARSWNENIVLGDVEILHFNSLLFF